MESGDRRWGEEILRSIDERLERLDREAQTGSVFAAEARDELQLTRLAYGQQLELTREVIDRNAAAFASWNETQASWADVQGQMIEAIRDLREEVRAQTRAIFRLLDRLDGGASPA